jgi:hypothetical protein
MNGHGGKRPGAGRPKGAASRANEQVRQEAAATGELPLAYMLRVSPLAAHRFAGCPQQLPQMDFSWMGDLPRISDEAAARRRQRDLQNSMIVSAMLGCMARNGYIVQD